jgi:hypothetical protein
MEIEQFLKDNELRISQKILNFCNDGVRRMKKTRDPIHDDKHISRLISNLSSLIQAEKPAMDIEVVLTAICWHDVWKATRFPAVTTRVVLDQYWDGYGSAKIFKKAAKKANLESDLVRRAYYAIREHGRLHFAKTKTNEAKILQDVDGLDEWYFGRIEPLKTKYLSANNPNRRMLKLAKFYFDHFMSKQTAEDFYFNWSKKEFVERKKAYLVEVDRLIKEYGSLVN